MKSLESSIGQAQPSQSAKWMQACAAAGINAEHAAFTDILRFLRDSGFGVDVFVIRAVDRVKIKFAEDAFMDVFTERAQTELIFPRGGKPRAYVQVLTRPPRGEVAAPAATRDHRKVRLISNVPVGLARRASSRNGARDSSLVQLRRVPFQ